MAKQLCIPVQLLGRRTTEVKLIEFSQIPVNTARSMGADASRFFRLAADLPSIFKDRAVIACGGTKTRGSRTKQPSDNAVT